MKNVLLDLKNTMQNRPPDSGRMLFPGTSHPCDPSHSAGVSATAGVSGRPCFFRDFKEREFTGGYNNAQSVPGQGRPGGEGFVRGRALPSFYLIFPCHAVFLTKGIGPANAPGPGMHFEQ